MVLYVIYHDDVLYVVDLDAAVNVVGLIDRCVCRPLHFNSYCFHTQSSLDDVSAVPILKSEALKGLKHNL